MRYIILAFILLSKAGPIYALTENQAKHFFHLSNQHTTTFLNIKGYQQTTDYTCGPAIVMSLLRYYGKLSESQMNQKMEMCIAKEMGTTKSEGTNEDQLVCWLNNHGFRAKACYNGSLQMLRTKLTEGTPVLVDWIDWGGHWVAVAGYDSSPNTNNLDHATIFFADSAAHFDGMKTRDGITFINADRFANMWLNSKLQRNIYIIATPLDCNSSLTWKQIEGINQCP